MTTETMRTAQPDSLAMGDGGASPPSPPGDDESRRGRGPGRRAFAGALALVVAGAVGGGVAAHQIWRPRPTAAADVSPMVGSGGTAPTAPNTPGGSGFPRFSPFGEQQQGSGQTSSGGSSGSGPANASSIAAKVDAGVVDINTTVGYQGAEAAGTGMVLTSTGEVLTNNHVISGATSISVTDVGNGKTYRATVVGYDRTHDVAVLQLQGASGLTTVQTATAAPKVGAGVVGVGNAGGSGGTPSYAAGVVTAVNQTITATDASDGTSEQLTGLLETNAAIVAGDSGGPLVDAQGRVVGMDTAASDGFSFSGTSQAYAIPIGEALSIARRIEAGQGSSTVHIGGTAMLGVGVEPDQSEQGGFAGGFSDDGSGALVAGVVSGGPAAKAGLAAGDTIVGVDGHAVTSAAALSRVVLGEKPGATVSVTYVDTTGRRHTAHVRLVEGPPQ